MGKTENIKKGKREKEPIGLRTRNLAHQRVHTAWPTYLHAARGRSLLRGPAGQPPSAYFLHRVCSLFGCVVGPTCQPRLQQPCPSMAEAPAELGLHCLKLAHRLATIKGPSRHDLFPRFRPSASSQTSTVNREGERGSWEPVRATGRSWKAISGASLAELPLLGMRLRLLHMRLVSFGVMHRTSGNCSPEQYFRRGAAPCRRLGSRHQNRG